MHSTLPQRLPHRDFEFWESSFGVHAGSRVALPSPFEIYMSLSLAIQALATALARLCRIFKLDGCDPLRGHDAGVAAPKKACSPKRWFIIIMTE